MKPLINTVHYFSPFLAFSFFKCTTAVVIVKGGGAKIGERFSGYPDLTHLFRISRSALVFFLKENQLRIPIPSMIIGEESSA